MQPASTEVERWQHEGLRVLTVLDADYPDNLRAVHDRPALIFLAGPLDPGDVRSVAIIGSRRATTEGLDRAGRCAAELSRLGYTIVSGLATGIDTAAHTATLATRGRTIAVIGTGHHHAYPPENRDLQHQIAATGAVVSQFWPESEASRETFPQRNAVMSGLAAGTVIIEATQRSGARIQARQALAHGRPVFLARELLDQGWARELAAQPGVSSFSTAEEVAATLESLRDPTALTA
ncbi:MAG: DNA-processing protein DprA [Solirubrobacteraceae bacterium]